MMAFLFVMKLKLSLICNQLQASTLIILATSNTDDGVYLDIAVNDFWVG